MSNVIKFPDMFSAAAGKVQTVSGAEEAKQCIKCALHTIKGEVLGDAEFGSSLKELLFDHMTALTKVEITEEIMRVANLYAKDIVITRISQIENEPLTTSTGIKIHYYIKSLGHKDSTEITY